MCDWYNIAKDFAGPAVGLGATIVALRAIRANKAVSGRRATLDMIFQLSKDVVYKEALKTVRQMRREGIDTGALLTNFRRGEGNPQEKDLHRSRFEAAQTVLNTLSIYANGIRSGALDEQSFKDYYFSTYVEIVGYLRGLMLSVRQTAKAQVKEHQYVSPETLYSELGNL